MYIIQPHYHAIARTCQDYERMSQSGVVAVAEPAFWAGFDRDYAGTFLDYFKQISEFEPTRAADYGIKHFCWIAVNPKEADNLDVAREVLKEIPKLLDKPTVLGIGETGLNKSSKNEIEIMEEHIELSIKYDQLLLIHTPHLADKSIGTKIILDVLHNRRNEINPEKVWIDHVENHTIQAVKDAGYWYGFTLYPITKCSINRCVDMIERYGTERLLVNSSADWGPSDPMLLQQAIIECQRRGHSRNEIIEIFHNNPAKYLGQSEKFKIKPIRIIELD
ncbi:MAG: TatD family hydrolase [Planctomycetaceae bacterium]|jgi:predicted metal-dependent TIM-barrel fold hydrolase|nr:TatD family hydrolase [Planctomycetaceae bacterium]